ncbi:hypothetical protein MKW92_016133, partial [Papaver armeniacum]
MSMVDNSLESFLAKTSPRMRTLVRLRVNVFNESTSSLESIFSYLKCLCVLDLRNTDISEIPDSICTMKHLRYLNLSFTKIKQLPNEYFCGLINLQILKLRSCSHLTSLPQDMSKLINLRHLDIEGCYNLAQMPPWMGNLIFLRTLSVFIVGDRRRDGCGIEQLKNIKHLKGNLMIKGLEQINIVTDASNSKLVEKQDLQSLELLKCISNEFYHHDNQRFNSDRVISSFPSLEELDIHDMLNLEEFSSPSSSSSAAFPCLRTLKIKNCPKLRIFFSLPSSIEELDLQESHTMVILKSLEKLPSCLSQLKIKRFPDLVSFPDVEEEELGRLSNLTRLQIWECQKLKALPEKFIKNLISLTDFEISYCDKLTQLPEGMHDIKSLKLLWIEHCGSLTSLNRGLRNLTKLENLRICYCPKLKLFADDFQNL